MATTLLPDRFRRSTEDRWIGGVAGGVARAVGIDAVVVRTAFAVLAFTSGVGVLLYVAAMVLVPAGDVPEAERPPDRRELEQAAGVGLITLGLLLLLRRAGLFFPDEVVWPAALAVMGVAVAWSQLGRRGELLDGNGAVVVRLVAGALLLTVGIGVFVAQNERIVVAVQVVLAVAAATVGVALLAGPWIIGLGRQLADERRERIRADERAELAAHLHDSVLQTLALIQRRADSPAETVALARRQERELREWLHGRKRAVADDDSVAGALRSIADEVEADHSVTVDIVVVGDALLDDGRAAVVGAVREAVVNAARHSGSPSVSVYVELSPDETVGYVRDRGSGFDPDAVPADRQGIRESIVGRLERHGGSAQITSNPEGTEVSLRLPQKRVVRS